MDVLVSVGFNTIKFKYNLKNTFFTEYDIFSAQNVNQKFVPCAARPVFFF